MLPETGGVQNGLPGTLWGPCSFCASANMAETGLSREAGAPQTYGNSHRSMEARSSQISEEYQSTGVGFATKSEKGGKEPSRKPPPAAGCLQPVRLLLPGWAKPGATTPPLQPPPEQGGRAGEGGAESRVGLSQNGDR